MVVSFLVLLKCKEGQREYIPSTGRMTPHRADWTVVGFASGDAVDIWRFGRDVTGMKARGHGVGRVGIRGRWLGVLAEKLCNLISSFFDKLPFETYAC